MEGLTFETEHPPIPGKCQCVVCQEDRYGRRVWMPSGGCCGNKRCPKASNHQNACTGSNEPGQPGSMY